MCVGGGGGGVGGGVVPEFLKKPIAADNFPGVGGDWILPWTL